MARKNRVSVYDGIYHVTSRIANRAMLLAEDEVKDRIMEWTVSVADFSGIEVGAFCIMDNHLHLFVHVPPVPERYWLDPDDEPAARVTIGQEVPCVSLGAAASESAKCRGLGFSRDSGTKASARGAVCAIETT